ncbi:MAG: IclR family transcriptional regulator [Deltaproteobacteria bacterium]|nr:IclR family transcriptional regulator [Deltaproteobacteria bacterium]
MKLQDNYRIKSFDKIVSVLRLFSAERQTLEFKEIQEALGFNKSTLYRLLSNLVEQELLCQDASDHRYKLGPFLARFGFITCQNFSLRNISAPILKELAARTGKTVHLAQRIGNEAFYLDRQDGQETLIVKSRTGMTRPIYSTGLGKVLAAYLKEDELKKLVNNIEFKPFTQNTITDPKLFMEKMKEIREKGYALDNREHNMDIRCVAVPVWGNSQIVISAISIAGPYFHFNSRTIPRFAREAKDAAAKIHSEIIKSGVEI